MANTYTKIFFHIVFAVKGRESLLPLTEQLRVHKYMEATLRNMGQTPIAIGGVENHVHILIEFKPNISISDMVRDLKTSVTKMINSKHLVAYQFAWQRGYACFSYSPSQIDSVKKYILNQPMHHKNISLREEMKIAYDRFGIEFDEKYIFEE